jgi:predicted GNAT family acetyltransferase
MRVTRVHMGEITDHTARRRFELEEEGKLAFANYRREGEVLILPHVESHPDLRGKGTAGRLMAGVLDLARKRGLKVLPICGYAAAYIQRHPEYHDLLSGED